MCNLSELKKIQDATSSLEKHQIMKSSDNLLAFINVVKKNLNPFDCAEMNNDLLYNIKTGPCASESVADFLLNVEKRTGTAR